MNASNNITYLNNFLEFYFLAKIRVLKIPIPSMDRSSGYYIYNMENSLIDMTSL
jgi:hypothetical protein